VGRLLVGIGAVVALLGLLMMAGVPIGRLPLDFSYRRGGSSFYFPLGTSILVSIILTLLLSLLRR